MMPPLTPPGALAAGAVPRQPGCGAVVGLRGCAAVVAPRPALVAAPAVGIAPGVADAPAVPTPIPVFWPAMIGTKSSFVTGSLNFLRRKCSLSRTSRLGGYAFAYFRWNMPIACAYCIPRKTSSSSRSRCVICFQTGMATVSMTAMMLMATSNAAIAYPCSWLH